MSRFGKIATGVLLVLPLSLGGCKPRKGTANPEDYYPLIQVALAGGETAAMIGRNEALKAKHFEGCVAAEALITAFDSATEVVAGRLQDQIVIPAVDIDVSECLAVREAPDVEVTGVDEENASLDVPVVWRTAVAGYSTAPVEEEDADSTVSAEEAEAEAEEESAPENDTAPAEEEGTAEEESSSEEGAVLKGHPDVAALVEAIAGITVAAVLHYAAKLKTVNCKKGTAAIGAVNYVGGMIKPVADEIADPDGMVSVPSVVIDLSECEGG